MKQFTKLYLLMMILPSLAHAASYDCVKADIMIEKLICSDGELSKLDEELNEAYKIALKDESQDEVIRESQKKWVRYRNNCKDVDCVKYAYEMRLSSLTVTHVYESMTDDENTSQDVPEYAPATIDLRKPGYPFKLINGTGVEVCNVYKKNLESLGNSNLTCERKISADYEGLIRFPEWRKLDLWENRNLWYQVETAANGGINMPGRMELKVTVDKQKEIDSLAKGYQEHAEQYHEEIYKLSLAKIDMDNDGRSELVLREHSGLCDEPVHYKSTALFVLDDKSNSLDLIKSKPLFQDPWYNPSAKKLEQSGIFLNGSMYDIFIYKDKTYFDRWSFTGVWIYQISKGKTEVICHLK